MYHWPHSKGYSIFTFPTGWALKNGHFEILTLGEDKHYALFPFPQLWLPNSPQTILHNQHIFLHPNNSEQATMHSLQEWINGPRDINLHTALSSLLWSVGGRPPQDFSIHMNCHPKITSNCKRPFTLAHMQNRNSRCAPLLDSTVFPIIIVCLGILHNWCINLSVTCCAGFFGSSKTIC